jgi:DNA-binding PadR family transcriptional regulator
MSKPNGLEAASMIPLSTPVFQILLSLNHRDLHGYGIIQDISARTEGELTLSTSTLYGAIKRMIRDDLIQQSDIRPDPDLDDERRRYYEITDFGREVARCEARRIEKLAEMIKKTRFVERTS